MAGHAAGDSREKARSRLEEHKMTMTRNRTAATTADTPTFGFLQKMTPLLIVALLVLATFAGASLLTAHPSTTTSNTLRFGAVTAPGMPATATINTGVSSHVTQGILAIHTAPILPQRPTWNTLIAETTIAPADAMKELEKLYRTGGTPSTDPTFTSETTIAPANAMKELEKLYRTGGTSSTALQLAIKKLLGSEMVVDFGLGNGTWTRTTLTSGAMTTAQCDGITGSPIFACGPRLSIGWQMARVHYQGQVAIVDTAAPATFIAI